MNTLCHSAHRRPPLLSLLLLAAALGLPAVSDGAQPVQDGETNSINNAFVFYTNTVFVGSNGSFTLLILTNNATVTNVGNLVIGENTGANSNTVSVGTLCTWGISNNLYVGSNGSFNRLIITNIGTFASVYSRIARVGTATNSSNNQVIVTGAGALWSNSVNTIIGDQGSGNMVIVNNGADVQTASGDIGNNTSSDRNQLIVDGSGSTFTSAANLLVGNFGSSNLLLVTNGARVSDDKGELGAGSPGSNNTAIVTGVGSLWTNRDELDVGLAAGGQTLLVSNSGTVFASNAIILGVNSGVLSNVLTVAGGNVTVTNAARTGALIVGQDGGGTLNFNGGTITANQFFVTNNGVGFTNSVFNFAAGTLTINNGSQISATAGVANLRIGTATNQTATLNLLGGTNAWATDQTLFAVSNGSRALITVSGTGTLWSNTTGVLSLGGAGSSGSQLSVLSGADVKTGTGVSNYIFSLWIGLPSSSSNSVLISGSGSTWSNFGLGLVDIGIDNTFGNSLVISNGASANWDYEVNLGQYSGASNNTLVVTGTGSVLRHGSFGEGGSQNLLLISNSADVFGSSAGIGGTSNRAILTGSGSTWTITNDLNLGETGNLFITSNGAALFVSNVTFTTSGSNFTVIVTDPNTQWNVSNAITMSEPVNALLLISNGAVVRSRSASVSGDFNQIIVTGANSVWTNSQSLTIPNYGTSNQVSVLAGGQLYCSNANVGLNGTPGGSFVLISGPGSRWFNQGQLLVASLSSGCQVTVSNEGGMFSTSGTIGSGISSGGLGASNSVMVTGTNSFWTNTGPLTIGASGAANRVTVDNGARLLSFDAIVGRFSNGNNNAALILNTSRWDVLGTLDVGQTGAVNQLVVSNAATVLISNALSVGSGTNSSNNQVVIFGGSVVTNGGTALIGASSNANANTVIVSGPGSSCRAQANLQVGSSGSFNRLVVSNGALVQALTGSSSIGLFAGSSNNEAVVTDAGSLWSNAINLIVGNFGSGNRLVVSNGGTVVMASNVFLGLNAGSTNNRLIVDGGTLRVTNSSNNGTLEVDRGTNVLNGGLIEVDRLLVANTLGAFEFNGGTLITEATTNNNGRLFTVGNGTSAATLRLNGGTHVFSNNLVIASNAALIGTGTILGTVTNFGSMSAGMSPGSLTINGNLRLQPSAGMTFEIGGLLATNQYDQVTVTNFVEFAGTLSLTLINNYLPNPGDTFTLMQFATSSRDRRGALCGQRWRRPGRLAGTGRRHRPEQSGELPRNGLDRGGFSPPHRPPVPKRQREKLSGGILERSRGLAGGDRSLLHQSFRRHHPVGGRRHAHRRAAGGEALLSRAAGAVNSGLETRPTSFPCPSPAPPARGGRSGRGGPWSIGGGCFRRGHPRRRSGRARGRGRSRSARAGA
ncbi:MAG: hypothetical protein HY301_08795 [Verrucomicrobia bacterium]|nr:hypothetical protein [Verrucomicrobiota bacterium]